jgi:hypothetical protein
MTERPDDLSFASPGPGGATHTGSPAAGAEGRVGPRPTAAGTSRPSGPDGRDVRDVREQAGPAVPADEALGGTPYGERWGAPGGPTPAQRAAARRAARIWVGAVLAAIVVVVGLAAGVSAAVSRAHEQAWAPMTADVAEPTTVNAVQLVLGSCLADAPSSEVVTTVEVVPCTAPHAMQVVGRTDAAPDAVWPGDEVAARRAARACSTDLLGPAGRQSATEGLTFVVWTPSEESWAQGDRTGLCLAVDSGTRSSSLLE